METTQGIFAVESAVNELAAALHMDPVALREQGNMVKEGDVMPAYYGEKLNSCALDRCMARAKEMIGWGSEIPAWTWEMVRFAESASPWHAGPIHFQCRCGLCRNPRE